METNDSKGKPFTYDFWVKIPPSEGNKTEVVMIETAKLLDFCSKVLGFYTYIDFSGNRILVKVTENCIVTEMSIVDLKLEIKHYLRKVRKLESVWIEFFSKNRITENFAHNIETLHGLKFNISTADTAYFFYRNGIICVSKKGNSRLNYKDYNGYVWKQQILERDFVPDNNFLEFDFNIFLHNICNNDLSRYNSLVTIIGYLLHSYKDPSTAKAVIWLDKKIDSSGIANGGTGKSLLAKAISHIVCTVWKDGKKYNPNETFVYDDIRAYHGVLYFDDVKRHFNFEEYYSMITSKLTIKRKYKDSVTLSEANTPKLMISSNHMVFGTGGDTDERRRLEFEVGDYYSMNHTPKNEFNRNFFDDWSTQDWNKFDTLMMICVRYYLQNGIIYPDKINLQKHKLDGATHPDFVEFIDDNVEIENQYDKSRLLADFIKLCPEHRNISARTFKRWIDTWKTYRQFEIKHYKSNGKAMMRITKEVRN